MIVFYHNDPDGQASAAIVKMFVDQERASWNISDGTQLDPIQFIPMSYGMKFPWEKIKEEETVYMVDFSLPIDDMYKLASRCRLIWIDHHKNPVQDYAKKIKEGFPILNGLVKIGVDDTAVTDATKRLAGCELTWLYFTNGQLVIPHPIKWLGRYDVWDHEYDVRVVPFYYGMCSRSDTDPESALWDQLLNHKKFENAQAIADILKDGHVVIRYRDIDNARAMSCGAFEVEFEGVNFIACNTTCVSSLAFKSVFDPNKHQASLVFRFHKTGYWDISIYTDNESTIDMSAIARKHGGGGHAGAAGFRCKELPFDLPGDNRSAKT